MLEAVSVAGSEEVGSGWLFVAITSVVEPWKVASLTESELSLLDTELSWDVCGSLSSSDDKVLSKM